MTKANSCTDWTDFFGDFEDYSVEAFFYESRQTLSLEELYQAFKARYEAERREEASL